MSNQREVYKTLLQSLPIQEIVDLAEILKEKGFSEDDTIQQVSIMIDQMLDFTKLIKKNPAVGQAIEAIDDKLIATVIKIAVSVAKTRQLFKRR
tara:strand:- start:208 stop:489 length:282 start_codon:yes stop_codon:yes gene_type:complete